MRCQPRPRPSGRTRVPVSVVFTQTNPLRRVACVAGTQLQRGGPPGPRVLLGPFKPELGPRAVGTGGAECWVVRGREPQAPARPLSCQWARGQGIIAGWMQSPCRPALGLECRDSSVSHAFRLRPVKYFLLDKTQQLFVTRPTSNRQKLLAQGKKLFFKRSRGTQF